jgi:hypothetical protein
MSSNSETIKKIFRSLVSPAKDYQKFSVRKNKLLSQLNTHDILNPSTVKIIEVLGYENINMVTDDEKLNIVMFICVWQPTMLGDEWIKCFLECGVSLEHKDKNGLTTQDYLDKYYQR